MYVLQYLTPLKVIPKYCNSVLRHTLELSLSIVLPLQCALCNSALPSGSKLPLCPYCMHGIEYIGHKLCQKCHRPIEEGALCSRCLSGFDLGINFPIRSVSHHGGATRDLIILCKFKGQENLLHYLGIPLKKIALPFIEDNQKWFVVPVPLHRDKLIKRGFNLPDHMSITLAKSINGKYRPFWLRRDINTDTQVGKSFEERLSNMEQAFSCPCPEKVKGKHIFLVDDVTTSGATLASAAKPLIKAGANVVGLTLNRA